MTNARNAFSYQYVVVDVLGNELEINFMEACITFVVFIKRVE